MLCYSRSTLKKFNKYEGIQDMEKMYTYNIRFNTYNLDNNKVNALSKGLKNIYKDSRKQPQNSNSETKNCQLPASKGKRTS